MGDIELYSEIGNMQVWSVSECPSTFDILKELPLAKGKYNALFTYNQTAGKGQFDRKWFAEPYKNIAFSVLIPMNDQILANPTAFNMQLSLVALSAIQEYSDEPLTIKWPNDIYAGDRKIAGFLMSIVSVNAKKFFQVGLGINVNQQEWPSEVPNASSLALLNKSELKLKDVLDLLLKRIGRGISDFRIKQQSEILKCFNKILWKAGMEVSFEGSEGQIKKGLLKGVNKNGQLEINTSKGLLSFHLGEIRLLIN